MIEKVKLYLPKPQRQCSCHDNEPPPWTGEIHGVSQALASEKTVVKAFWWLVVLICLCLGTYTTILVITEYIQGPTATSTIIKTVDELELPVITICPKYPDSFHRAALLENIHEKLPDLDKNTTDDLIKYFVAGNGLENMNDVTYFNQSYLDELNELYNIWSKGYATETFFDSIWNKFGYKCEDMFLSCRIGGTMFDCCKNLMVPQRVMRRGMCYQLKKGANQTEPDDNGRLLLSMKAPPSATSESSNYTQPQLILYVTDNHDIITDFPRYYLYANEWNRARLTARYLELIQMKDVCTNAIFGRDAMCIVRKWYLSNIIYPFNCTLSYMPAVTKLPPTEGTCALNVIAQNYLDNIQYVYDTIPVEEKCLPGCNRWDYTMTLQQSVALEQFEGYTFNFEASYSDMQFEYVKEVYTTSVPGFMSQIGGQFGFFLGLSIITLIQMFIFGVRSLILLVVKLYKHRNQ